MYFKRNTKDGSSLTAIEKVVPNNVLTTTTSDASDHRVLDSGTLFHMMSKSDYFSSFDKMDGSAILMGKDACCRAMREGTVSIHIFD